MMLLLTFAAWGKTGQIVVRPYTALTAQDKVVTLDKIAEIRHFSEIERSQLGSIKLADAPSSGESRVFTPQAITEAIQAINVNNKFTHELKLPSKIVVEMPEEVISRSVVENRLTQQWKKQCEECEFRIVRLSVPQIKLTTGDQWNVQIPAERPRGSFTMPIEVTRLQGEPQTYWLKGQVAVYREVMVTKRTINMGERLQESDYEAQMRDVTFVTDGIVGAEDIIGKRFKQSLTANAMILMGHMEREKALRRGEVVKVQSTEDNFEIYMSGVAEQDGFIGDTVNVRNPKTNQVVSARVVAKGEVQVQ